MNYFEVLIWPGGGVIGLVLWLMSVVTVAIGVQYFVAIRRETILPEKLYKQIRALFQAKQYKEISELTGRDGSFISHVIHCGLSESQHGYPAMERAMEEAAEDRTTKLLRHIAWLNLMGNISPMLGLLGTVWGMINAFFTIVQVGGQVDAGKLAGSIGIALVTTLLGLAIAIPALAVYSIMRNRIDALSSEAMVLCQELLSSVQATGRTR